MSNYFSTCSMLLVFALSACGGEDTETVEPKLSDIQEKIFAPSCAFSSCHDAVGPENELDLSGANTYSSLMDGASPDTDVARVVAGDPDQSLLYLSLVGEAPAGIRAMPLGNSLSEAEISAIKTWIQDGALNN